MNGISGLRAPLCHVRTQGAIWNTEDGPHQDPTMLHPSSLQNFEKQTTLFKSHSVDGTCHSSPNGVRQPLQVSPPSSTPEEGHPCRTSTSPFADCPSDRLATEM